MKCFCNYIFPHYITVLSFTEGITFECKLEYRGGLQGYWFCISTLLRFWISIFFHFCIFAWLHFTKTLLRGDFLSWNMFWNTVAWTVLSYWFCISITTLLRFWTKASQKLHRSVHIFQSLQWIDMVIKLTSVVQSFSCFKF